jgi:hypothetical protein
MSDLSKIALIKNKVDTAFDLLAEAKQLLANITSATASVSLEEYTAQAVNKGTKSQDGESKIVEGIFNGYEMIGPDGARYPVPSNYASKSKLVAGDLLKLTIGADGRFLYKQIGPIPRKYLVGPLTCENNQFFVITEEKSYKVLLASVTYFKAEIGDEITIIIPDQQESEWAAIEAVIPAQ